MLEQGVKSRHRQVGHSRKHRKVEVGIAQEQLHMGECRSQPLRITQGFEVLSRRWTLFDDGIQQRIGRSDPSRDAAHGPVLTSGDAFGTAITDARGGRPREEHWRIKHGYEIQRGEDSILDMGPTTDGPIPIGNGNAMVDSGGDAERLIQPNGDRCTILELDEVSAVLQMCNRHKWQGAPAGAERMAHRGEIASQEVEGKGFLNEGRQKTTMGGDNDGHGVCFPQTARSTAREWRVNRTTRHRLDRSDIPNLVSMPCHMSSGWIRGPQASWNGRQEFGV